MTSIPEKMLAIHRSLAAAVIPHAFGGALALAWCTQRARGTIDIDLNVFVPTERTGDVLAALPDEIRWEAKEAARLAREGQQRLWWDATPVDLFLNTTEFHEGAAGRARWELFEGAQLPFLSCADLAVFKAFYDRTKDWADLEEMRDAGTLDVDRVVGVLVRYLGADDPRVERALSLSRHV
ncbi:MAG TPA: hypothetical protein VMT43_05850 [Acidimicrobiales bacterium]|nr:hypothetical protein [Acidimicrobiales bacterium]